MYSSFVSSHCSISMRMLVLVLMLLAPICIEAGVTPDSRPDPDLEQPAGSATLYVSSLRFPLRFERNTGQSDPDVD
ncbi:hypothetical protein ACFLU6_12375, partial [Acidobacteriota bacterium]